MRLGPAVRTSSSKALPSIGAALVAVVVLTTGACGGGSSSGGASDAASSTSKDATVTIKDFKFSPEDLPIKAGTAVKVVNADDTEHTLTADDDSFDTGSLKGGGTASVTPDKAGKASYFCEIHDYMKGTFDVG